MLFRPLKCGFNIAPFWKRCISRHPASEFCILPILHDGIFTFDRENISLFMWELDVKAKLLDCCSSKHWYIKKRKDKIVKRAYFALTLPPPSHGTKALCFSCLDEYTTQAFGFDTSSFSQKEIPNLKMEVWLNDVNWRIWSPQKKKACCSGCKFHFTFPWSSELKKKT